VFPQDLVEHVRHAAHSDIQNLSATRGGTWSQFECNNRRGRLRCKYSGSVLVQSRVANSICHAVLLRMYRNFYMPTPLLMISTALSEPLHGISNCDTPSIETSFAHSIAAIAQFTLHPGKLSNENVTFTDFKSGGNTTGVIMEPSPTALHARAPANAVLRLRWTAWPASYQGPAVIHIARCLGNGKS
jgi:hypothetical protein